MSEDELVDHRNHVNEVIDRIGFGTFHIKAFAVLALGTFSLGANFGLVTILPFLLEYTWHLEDLEVSMLSSSFIVGGFFVCIFMIFYGDRAGRLQMVNTSFILLSLSVILAVYSQEIYTQSFSRFLNGIAFILSVNSASIYIIEVFPTKTRGPVSLAYWLIQSLGEILVMVVIYYFNPNLDKNNWRQMLFFSIIPGLISLVGNYLLMVESPLYLARNGNKDESIKQINLIAKQNKTSECTQQEKENILYMDATIHNSISFSQIFHKNLIKRNISIFIIWTLVLFGYYGIYFVFPFIIASGSSRVDVVIVGILCTISQAIVEFSLMMMIEMKYFGRKNTLALCAFIGMIACLTAVAKISYIWTFLSTSLTYGIFGGMFSIIFPYTSELYETKIRASIMGILNTFSRIFSVFSPAVFYFMLKFSTDIVFLALAFIMFVVLANVLIIGTETKGKVLDNKDH